MARTPHVAVLIETSRSYGRDLLRGVTRYAAAAGPWSVYVELRALESDVPPWLRSWSGDGILTRTASPKAAELIRRVGVPVVELRATKLRHGFPFVGVDNRAVGRTVAEHLLDRGFRRFAVYALDTEIFFEERRDSFVEAVEAAGFGAAVLHAPGHREKPAAWERHQDRLVRWLAGLPKPVGVMACTDQLGFWLLDACRRAGLAVPDEVAVVGVENDETLCSVATPPMSSVRLDGERVGHAAAALLDRLMAGETAVPPSPFAPLGVVTRRSSDVVALDDEDAAAAVRFIRDRACDGIGVADVLRAVPVSRSGLERKLRTALGRTPADEILRVKLGRARELLADTDLPLAAVARRSGFRYPQGLCEAFKRRFGVTPGAYRGRNGRDGTPEPISGDSE